MPRVLERIVRLSVQPSWADEPLVIRVWCSVPTLQAPVGPLEDALHSVLRPFLAGRQSAERMAEAIAVLSFCNAVEITDGDGQGVLIYPEWP